MKCTLDLLDMAVQTEPSERALSLALKLSPTTLATARARGRLSPIVAGKIADRIHQPIAEWIALAALEAEPHIRDTKAIERLAAKVRNSYFAALRKRAEAVAHRREKARRTAARTASSMIL